jgi:hypothetical protein
MLPTHGGIRLQGEGSIDLGLGVSGSIGLNVVYNRIDDRLLANVDWAVEPGLGYGEGISFTGGPLIGWLSTNVDDATAGYSIIFSGSAAAEGAVTVAITAPLEGLYPTYQVHVDSHYGQVPFTVYVGGGAGAAYAGVGAGINGPVTYNGEPLRSDYTAFLPWHWSIWK